ncbi:MAG: DUF3793 family protein [Clostridia bacterium]|nr:DUF3793 family protein [Clostridia bacterium]
MSEALIVRHCSPTLAGLKTANMFNYTYRDKAELTESIRSVNIMLKDKGVRMIPLRISDGRALIYVYRPERLEADLKCPLSGSILASCGYDGGSVSRLIKGLMERLVGSEEFPHEIGLFLGYPPEDVRCFMCDRNSGCRCVGCWRAYNNEKEAEKTFARFRKCTDVYCRKLREGYSLTRLTVAKA